jgi:hypothetical protein
MELDFTVKIYKLLLDTLLRQGFSFQTFSYYIEKAGSKTIILRHDVDKLPFNSLKFARIQAEMGIYGTYFMRITPEAFNEEIIREISALGHEVGYHYEDFVFASQKLKVKSKKSGDELRSDLHDLYDLQDKGRLEKVLADIAIETFAINLQKLRKLAPVKTICMHGSPTSRWDSRLLWKYYYYRDFGIIGEPYFDIDFDRVLYLTDTGRRWDGAYVSIRDKVTGVTTFAKTSVDEGLPATGENPYKDWKVKPVKYRSEMQLPPSPPLPIPPSTYHFHSTSDIIKAAGLGKLPDQIMTTFHPQRWTDRSIPWFKEIVWQNIKNAGKYYLLKINDFTK